MDKIQRKSAFHLKYRWVGLPLLFTGVLLFLFSISSYSQTHDWFVVLLGFGCGMVGLTSFGVNHDTAIALAVQLGKEEENVELQGTLRNELEEDLQWDRAGTLALKANPKTAIILPFLGILLQSYVFFRLMCALSFEFSGRAGICSSFLFGA